MNLVKILEMVLEFNMQKDDWSDLRIVRLFNSLCAKNM
jgi:hypothetical protein